jgi:hypothetical protein
LQEEHIGRHVLNYIEGKQDTQRASKSLERSSVELEQAVSKVEIKPQKKEMVKEIGGLEL